MKLNIQLFAEDAEVSIKFNNKVTGEKKLQKYAETLKTINSVLSGLNTGAARQIQSSASNIQIMNTDMGEMKNKASAAFDYLAITKYAGAIKKLGASFTNLAKQSFDYLENFNLFQVAFNGNYNSAERFINKMSEMYGLDESWLTQTVGKFKQLTNAMNLSAETGEKVSKLLTQMSLDISSLYNVDIDRAASTLSSAMAGQTKPIRGVAGADITQATLQTTLDQLDINSTVNQLSFAEKRLLIIISLTKQLNASIGDMGRTIESPSNQLRIMNEQWERLTRAVGNVFLPILAKILPYLNAILMVLTEIFSWLASLLGFKQDDFDYFDKASKNVYKYDAGLKSAGESAKKLKQGLRGFDKLNNITTPKTSSGGAGGGGVGGINPKLLGAFDKTFEEYQKKLKKVKMRATEIRDSIMEWLGFTKQVDEKTGKVSFKFEKITGGTILGALAVGGVIYKGVAFIFGLLRKIGLLKFPLVEKLIGKIFSSKDISSVKDGLNGAGDLGDSVNKNAKSFELPSIKTVLKGLAELAIIVAGLTALVVAIGLLTRINGFKEVATAGIDMLSNLMWGLAKAAIPLAAFSAGIVVLGTVGLKTVAIGLADLAMIIVGLTAIVTVIGAVMSIKGVQEAATTGVESIVKIFEGLGKILLPLGILTVGLAAIGLIGGTGAGLIISGLVSFGLVIAGTTTVVSLMGKLSETPFVKNNLDNGIELIVKLFEGLGRVVGAIAGGLISEVMNSIGKSLPKFGKNLSDFMDNAQSFFKGIKDVDQSSSKGVKYLAEALLILTASNIIDGLFGWLKGKGNIVDFGKELAEFAPYFKKYADTVKGIDGKVVEKSATAAKSLTEFSKNIPNKGGLVALLTGDNSLSEFAEELDEFGVAFLKYYKSVKNIDGDVVTKSSDAAESVAEFAKKIPNSGGLAGLISGNNDIDKFGKQLAKFGSSFKDYYKNVKDIGLDKINSVSDSIDKIVSFLVKIKDKGLNSVLKDFGKQLSNSADDIKKFYKDAFSEKTGTTIGEKFGAKIGEAIAKKIKNTSMPTIQVKDTSSNKNVASYKINAYAKGGLPPVGQLFVANENGAELVGHIGGQSFVANQNQVIDLIDKKLGQAQSNPINATFVIQVGNKEIANQVINDLQDVAKTNGKPIVIGS